MKHLIEWRLFESSKEEDIESICREYSIENWTLNEDGSIDVDGDVNLFLIKALNKLPLKFRNVSGYFNCSNNNLTSLEGSSKSIGGGFFCYNNNLISLEGSPEWVGSYFLCNNNNLTSLEGSPEFVGGYFDCSYNNLTSLEGSPKYVGGNFNCSYNNIISLEGAPELIKGYFDCKNNPVYQIWNLFKDEEKIEFFNDLDIIRGNLIIFDRLIYFLDAIGKPRTEEELRSLIKDYIFI
jgi:hypothetical protein